MGIDVKDDDSLDKVFVEVGEFKIYQIFLILLICIPSVLSAVFQVHFIFVTATLDYRCKIPECDTNLSSRDIQYDQSWLEYAIPMKNDKIDNCNRYEPLHPNTHYDQCSADIFNTSYQIPCTEFVYASDEVNIQTELNIHCEDTYKLALIGSVESIGRLVFLPLIGYFSDSYGRLTVLVASILLNCIFGLMKSFALDYYTFVIFDFFDAVSGAGVFEIAYVLGAELMSSRYRLLTTTAIIAAFPVGCVLVGVFAMYIHNFRTLIRIIYGIGLIFIAYAWIVPESIRWLLVTGRVDRAIKVLKRMASVNGKNLSTKSVEMLTLKYSSDQRIEISEPKLDDKPSNDENTTILGTLLIIMKSKKLFFRLLNGCYQWITCCYCYYGLSLISLHISGMDRYMSFIAVSATEIPGALLSVPLLKWMQRKTVLFISLFVTGISIIITPWIPEGNAMMVLTMSMIGKAAITCAFNVLYAYTVEQWPTNSRTTILTLCSTIGRIGLVLAPVTPLLAPIDPSLPYILFGGSAIIGGVLVLFGPNTSNKKLPDTMEEVKNL